MQGIEERGNILMDKMNSFSLEDLGWDSYFENEFKKVERPGCIPGRVFEEHTHLYKVYTEEGEVLGEISGRLRFNASGQEDFPAIGDWVALSLRPGEARATIHEILSRRSRFSRKVAGTVTREQIVAANIDRIFIMTSLNSEFNPRRLERYLTVAWESGASPVIVLSKADLCPDVTKRLLEVEAIAFGTPVHVISSVTKEGLVELEQYLQRGVTAALLGSSGVGKSTLINSLAGDELQRVSSISGYMDKGRHTTTHRELIILPSGGIIIDTPGMRELQLWEGSEGVHETFGDIEELAQKCRFNDCRHHREPGCAVKRAIEEGSLSRERYESYKKLQRELKYAEAKQEQQRRMLEKRNVKDTSHIRNSKKMEYDL